MGLVDFILNLAGLLMWLNWRARQLQPLAGSPPATLASTVRHAEPRRRRRYQSLLFLLLLLLVRAFLYRQLGSPADWTPRLDLGIVVLAFRNENFPVLLLYSGLSFLRVLAIFYFWLLVLVALSPRGQAPGPVERLLEFHLGKLASLPWPVQVLILPVLCGLSWAALHPVLTGSGVVEHVRSAGHLGLQALLVGGSLFFSLKYLLPVLLLIYLMISYVYLGASPVWEFVSATARRFLEPLRWFRVAKADFSPIAGVLLVLYLLHWLPNSALGYLAHRNVSLWPQ